MIVLFGAIGSGKTEQGDRLASRLKCPRTSSSHLLRQNHNPLHLRQIAEGALVSDQDVIKLLEPELQKIGADKNEFILDGFPRSIAQAKWLVEQIKSGQVKFTAIIYLKVPRQAVIDRLLKRGREDDKEEIIRRRLDEYTNVTTPVLDYLRRNGYKVYEVDGAAAPQQVEKNIAAILESKNAG